jgi:predicted TIM-barrel fold metal-dependent hydrolase
MSRPFSELPSYVRPAFDMHVHPSPREGGLVEEMLTAAEQVGITRLILSDLGSGAWRGHPSVQQVQQANERVYDAVSRYCGRAYGYVYVNPNHAETRDILEEGLALKGIVGIKLWVSCKDKRGSIDPVYSVLELAQERHVPVLIHAFDRTGGNQEGELLPGEIVHLARRYPQAAIVMAHLGGVWQRGVRVIRPVDNVYADICGSRAYLGMVELAVRELGAGRVLFGSDAHWRAFSGQIAKVIGAEIDVVDKRRILWDNSVQLFLGERSTSTDDC